LNLAFYIARRYLFAKKSHNAINIISTISVCGVVVATIAMICVLSVFNGFRELAVANFSFFDPDLKITPVAGKVFDPTTDEMRRVCELSEIQAYCGVLQENALVRYGDRQEISIVKGVDTTFRYLTQIDSAILDGEFRLKAGDINYAVIGQGLAASLGVNAAFAYPMEIFMPERTGSFNIANPTDFAVVEYAYIGGVYHVNQPIYDESFMLISIDVLRSMLSYEKEVSALELKLVPGTDVSATKKKITNLIGRDFMVKDRYEQQEASYKMIQIEKWVSFLMLCFILILALFNMVGSLAILIIEKEEDVNKLRSMGADNRLISRIFLFEGWMISLLGAVIGVAVGVALCLVQKYFGLISLGETAGMFIVDAYPVIVEGMDVLIVLITVITIGFIAVLYPVHYIGKKWLNKGVVICFLLLSISLAGCGGGQKKGTADGQKKEIAVTIEPLCYFAQKIAGEDYAFFSVLPVGRSPETYDPSLREMVRVGQSEAFFYMNQMPFERMLLKSIQENKSGAQLFDLSEGIDSLPHEPAGVRHDESHGAHDPHIWTSFIGVKMIAENVYKALSTLNKEKTTAYQSNYLRLKNELEQLETALHEQLDTLSCRGFVIYHPALTDFAKEFGLVQFSIEEDGKEPSPATLKRLIEEARSAKVKVVFVQMEFDRTHAEQVAAAIGARTVTVNPLDRQWDEQMKRIAKALITNWEMD